MPFLPLVVHEGSKVASWVEACQEVVRVLGASVAPQLVVLPGLKLHGHSAVVPRKHAVERLGTVFQ